MISLIASVTYLLEFFGVEFIQSIVSNKGNSDSSDFNDGKDVGLTPV